MTSVIIEKQKVQFNETQEKEEAARNSFPTQGTKTETTIIVPQNLKRR